MFSLRKNKFRSDLGQGVKVDEDSFVPPELDLVEEDDRITHEVSLDDPELGSKQNICEDANVFKHDPNWARNEDEWEKIKKEILGD